MMGRPIRRRAILAGALALAVLGAVLPGTAGAQSGDLSKLKADIKKYAAPVTSVRLPTSSPPIAQDKLIVILSCTEQAEGCTRIREGAEAAAAALGWRTESIDGQGDPAKYQAAIERAIALNADGILLAAVAEATISNELLRAREAGIVVAGARSGNIPSPEGENFNMDVNNNLLGRMMGAYAVTATNGKLKAAVFDDPEFPVIVKSNLAARKVIRACKSCEITADETFLAADLVDKLPALTLSVLERDPDINMLLNFDAALNFQAQALQAAGITQPKVKAIGFDGNAANLEDVRNGDTVQSASIGTAYGFMGYAAMDNFNRLFNDEQPVKTVVPIRLFTKKNIGNIKVWDTDFDYEAAYSDLWKI